MGTLSVDRTAVHTDDRDVAAAATSRIAPHRPGISFPDPDAVTFDLRSAACDGFSAHAITIRGMRYTAFAEPIDFLLAGAVLHGQSDITMRRQTCPIGSQGGFLYPLGAPYRCDSADIDLLHVGLPLSRVEQQAGGHLRFLGITPVSEPMRRFWVSTAAFLCQRFLDTSGVTPLMAEHLIALAASAVLAVFPNTTMTAARAPRPGGATSAVVRRAVAYADANAERRIGTADLAASAGVGTRALQAAFRRYLDTTPTAYLRRVRLDRAHRDLHDADPGTGVTVGEVARRWGFSSPGRFSHTYRAAYGRLPGETLRM